MNSTMHYHSSPPRCPFSIRLILTKGSMRSLPPKFWTCNTLPSPSWSMPRDSFDTACRHGPGHTCSLWRSRRSSCGIVGRTARKLEVCFAEPGLWYGRCPSYTHLCFGMAETPTPVLSYIEWTETVARPSLGEGRGI